MAACAPTGDNFLIFFHKAVEGPMMCSRAFYVVDFGVKKHDKVCHLRAFEAIAVAYDAIIALLTSH